MTTLDWIEIENFKGFGNPVTPPAFKNALKEFLKRNSSVGEKAIDEHIDEYVAILECIANKPSVSLSAFAVALKVSDRTVDSLISELKTAEVIRRVGGRKQGHWKVALIEGAFGPVKTSNGPVKTSNGPVNPRADQ